MKRFFSIGIFALALTAGSAEAASVFVRFGPPAPPREVVMVRPGPHHVWVAGHDEWRHNRYFWVRGYWAVPPRHHTAWVPGHWAHRRGGHVWVSGYWR